ncbi:MAG: hypothetical protein A2Y78_10150 [Acidobacteria bacterium RBG_13_68_16]|nr:MAG: hypothetical protein A2Y78_10150 [Acidobacteria bacterium RBG_13_68_16]
MAVVSLPTVVRAARAAGWSGTDLVTAVAIAGAESRYNATAVGKPNSNGSRDYGLWQINSVHNPTAQNWRDPATNARMAHKVWSDAGRKWTPWSAFKNRSYLLFWPASVAAVGVDASPAGDAAATVGSVGDTVSGAAGAVPAALDQVGDVVEALGRQETWLRVAKVVTGTILVGVGVYLVARPVVEPAARAATKAATKVATKGAVK